MALRTDIHPPKMPKNKLMRIHPEDYERIEKFAKEASINQPEALHVLMTTPPVMKPSIDWEKRIKEQAEEHDRFFRELVKMMATFEDKIGKAYQIFFNSNPVQSVNESNRREEKYIALIQETCEVMNSIILYLEKSKNSNPAQKDKILEIEFESMKEQHEIRMKELDIILSKENRETQMQLAKFNYDAKNRQEMLDMVLASFTGSMTAFVDIFKSAVEAFAATNKKESIKEE